MNDDEQPLGSRYLKQKLLGSGAAGEVWEVSCRDGSPALAAKILRAKHARNLEVRARFLDEKQMQERLDHAGIVRIRDVVVEGSVVALVMDLVRGTNLQTHLGIESTLTSARACFVLRQVAEAVAAAHEAGVVHRDLKPDNIMIPDDSRDVAKIVDFGVARALNGSGLTQGACVLGTEAYLSPEVRAGKPAQPASDVYALGLVLTEALIGRCPTEPERRQLASKRTASSPTLSDLPEPLRNIIASCLESKPAKRPTAHALAVALRRIEPALEGLPRLKAAPGPDIEQILADSKAGLTGSGAITAGWVGVLSRWRRQVRARGLAVSERWPRSLVWVGTALALLAVMVGALLAPELLPGGAGSDSKITNVAGGAGGGEELNLGPIPVVPSSSASAPPTTTSPPEPVVVPGSPAMTTSSPPASSGPPAETTPPSATRTSEPPTSTRPPMTAQPPAQRQPQEPSVVLPPPTTTKPPAPAPKVTQPYTAEGKCGPGFAVRESHKLARAVVYLLWNGTYKQNCVITLKTADLGVSTPTSVYLRVVSGESAVDSGTYEFFAGAVRLTAPSCIYWGGSDGITSYDSPKGHC